jgi:hypothetical protein
MISITYLLLLSRKWVSKKPPQKCRFENQ